MAIEPLKPQERALHQFEMYRLGIPYQVWEETIALSKLAEDVFNDPSIAQQFTADPQGYLNQTGLGHVTLPVDTLEVKTALAMGDATVQQALNTGDVSLLFQRLEQLGIIASPPPTSILSDKLQPYLTEIYNQPYIGCRVVLIACIAVAPVAVAVAAAVLAAVAVKALAVVDVKVKVTSWPWPKPKPKLFPTKVLVALGGEVLGIKAVGQLIDEWTEKVAVAIESLPLYQNPPPGKTPPDAPSLRNIIRAELELALLGEECL
ncbi:MAG: hypothetical protein QXU40_03610 [Candidatus Pacearchaeota archaeon]